VVVQGGEKGSGREARGGGWSVSNAKGGCAHETSRIAMGWGGGMSDASGGGENPVCRNKKNGRRV